MMRDLQATTRKAIYLGGVAFVLGVVVSATFAAGGKNQINNPIFGEECVEVMPPGIDSEACEESPAPAQSGVKVYFCDTTTIVICPEEETEE
jgi:hypothetical protein